MKILVIGGSRYVGVHLVNMLLNDLHEVTIANRGITKDNFENKVSRIIFNRKDLNSIKVAFENKYYDVVIDNIAYSSNDVFNILEVIKTSRYILTSSVSVYTNLHLNLKEEEVDTKILDYKMCDYQDVDYTTGKIYAECVLFQKYKTLSSVAVRFPWIFGNDDYTLRLAYYVENIIKRKPININNINEPLSFISSTEAASFLNFCINSNIKGYVNASSSGVISLKEIVNYIENKTNIKMILDTTIPHSPLSDELGFSLNLDKTLNLGYKFEDISWVYKTIDYYIKIYSN